MDRVPALVADVGGTNVRFALVDSDGRLTDLRHFKCRRFSGPTEAVSTYLDEVAPGARPSSMAMAVACPVLEDEIRITNLEWVFSGEHMRLDLGLERMVVVNDFEALALAIPALEEGDTQAIQPGDSEALAPIAVLGPGTGLGSGGLVYSEGSWIAIAAEGGHRDLAPATEREWEVFRALQARFDHVSAERVLSGPGLVNLYDALSAPAQEGRRRLPEPEEIARLALTGDSEIASEVMQLFCAWLGAVAGDLALTLGARGGVYLGGGVLGKLGGAFDHEVFCARFRAKGRFSSYLREIPIRLITRRGATLLGAARVLQQD
ncbi:MAG: glucokinase [Acidobacteriota bacterium]|nr:glucokinase [Acidobacteriota bacterium]